jgi:5-methylcytosine-specific restriction enzyme A
MAERFGSNGSDVVGFGFGEIIFPRIGGAKSGRAAMPRSVEEWIGKTDDTPAPPRVRLRVFERAQGVCACCTRRIEAGQRWEADHVVAIINGGANRESNLQLLCEWCHDAKTKRDVREKSVI